MLCDLGARRRHLVRVGQADAVRVGRLPVQRSAACDSGASVAGIPEAWASAAIVIDLPGAESVAVGLALAERGFRPVPLFNNTSGPSPVIDTQALVDALGAGTTVLQAQTLKPDARPAFLVDSRRSVASAPESLAVTTIAGSCCRRTFRRPRFSAITASRK